MIKRICCGLFLLLLLSGCGQEQYEEQKADKSYTISFSRLDTAKSHSLSLDQGELLAVEIVCEGGDIKLQIKGDDGAEAYSGNRLATSSFTVGVPAEGSYTVTVTGERAKGRVKVRAGKAA